jgi:uncharacterized protein YegL
MVSDPLPGSLPPDITLNQETRCPCMLVLDTSTSMAGAPIDALNKGLADFAKAVKDDKIASARVEVAIITFGPVQVVQDFVGASDFEPPKLEVEDKTPLGEAVIRGLDLIEDRKSAYKQNDISYYRPWLLLMSDGASTDDVSAAAARAQDAESGKHAQIYAVGVGDDFDKEELAKVSPARPPLTLQGLAFEELFKWVSASLSTRTRSNNTSDVPTDEHEQVALPPVSGWAVTD